MTNTTFDSTKTQNLSSKLLNRSWWQHWIYPMLFLLAMILSLSTYLTLDSIQQSVNDYVDANQKALVGGDLILTSQQPWTDDILKEVSTFAQKPNNGVVYDHQFNAMIANVDKTSQSQTTLLARIKAVSTGYPLYGEMVLASGQPLWRKLGKQSVVVETQVLTGLNLKVGDSLKIGDAIFTIADEIITEPDRPLTAFGFGARVLMNDEDLAATNLMGQRSRVSYRIEMAGMPTDVDQIHNTLNRLLEHRAAWQAVKLETAETSDTSISRVSNNILIFLKLLVLAVLFLSAVALLGVVKAFVAGQQTSNAIRRAIGESVHSIQLSYYRLFLSMAALACAISFLSSFALLHLAAPYLSAILPNGIDLSLNTISVIKIVVVALGITILVVHHSLYVVVYTKPSAVFKQTNQHSVQRLPQYWYAIILLASIGLMVWEFRSLRDGVQVFIGMGLLALGFWLVSKAWLWALSKLASGGIAGKKLSWLNRTAIHNLSRKGNQSGLFFVTLALSVSVLTMVTLLNQSLNSQLVQAYPKDAPNLFLLDVQTDQHDKLQDIINAPITYYPVVRARVSKAGGVSADKIEVPRGEGDDPTRTFNLSYADHVMQTEFIKDSVVANQLYAPVTSHHSDTNGTSNAQIVPLSILDSAADLLQVSMGDTIVFNIQGIEIIGEITSIRERYERGPSPFFYFLFEPKVLANAPQIQFATVRVETARIPKLQTELAQQFPAITSIDGGAIAKQVQGFVAQMSQLVQIFTILALITGLMVLITSLLSTSQDRLKDSASFRLLGMQTKDLYKINIIEIGLLGMSAGIFAVGFASAMAYILISQWFHLRFSIPWNSFAIGAIVLLGILIVIAVSYVRLVIGKGIMARVREMI